MGVENRCSKVECPFNNEGICESANRLDTEATYLGRPKLWVDFATAYNKGETAKVRSDRQKIRVKRRALSIVKKYCGANHDALRNSLKRFKQNT